MLPTYDEVSRRIAETDAWHQLETKRSFFLKLRCLVWAGGVIVSLSGVWLFWLFFLTDFLPENNSEGAVYAMVLFLMIVLLGVFFIWRGNRLVHKKYSKHYKKLIVPPLVENLIQHASHSTETADARYTCQYTMDKGIPLEQIKAFPMFDVLKYSRDSKDCTGEDLFVGTLGLTDFQLAEMKIWERSTDAEGVDGKIVHFTGLILLADFHKPFEGTVVIHSRKGKANALKRVVGSKVKSNNDAFNQQFRISTNNQVILPSLLSNRIIEQLLDLHSKFPRNGMSICLHNGMLALALHHVDLFETDGLKRLEAGAIHHTYDEIKSMFELVDLFNHR